MTDYGTSHSFGSLLVITTFGGEALGVLYDLRWAVLFLLLLIVVDFWFGACESSQHYKEAEDTDDKEGMRRYAFHFSRACRKSLVKAVDYIGILVLGVLAGLAIFEPLQWCNHQTTAAISLLIALILEGWSIVLHLFVLHGYEVDRSSFRTTLTSVGKVVLVRLVKHKSPEVGEAIEDVFKENEEKE